MGRDGARNPLEFMGLGAVPPYRPGLGAWAFGVWAIAPTLPLYRDQPDLAQDLDALNGFLLSCLFNHGDQGVMGIFGILQFVVEGNAHRNRLIELMNR